MKARTATATLAVAAAGMFACRGNDAAPATPPDDAAPPLRELVRGTDAAAQLRRGERHAFAVRGVRAGELIDVSASQTELDLTVEVHAPSGVRVALLDDVRAVTGAESGVFVAAESGVYRVVVRPSLEVAGAGAYTLRVAPARAPSDDDRRRAEAVALVQQAREHADAAGDRLPHAMDAWRRAAALWEQLGDERRRAEALSELGRAFDLGGNNERARQLREEALAIQRAIGDRYGEAVTLYGLARVHTSTGEVARALAEYEQAAARFREVGAPVGEAKAVHNAAATLSDLGEPARAMEMVEGALATFEKLGLQENIGVELYELGVLYAQIGDESRALEHLQRARAIFAERKLVWDEGRAVAYLGRLLATRGDVDEGIGLLERALDMSRQAGDRRNEAAALNDLGRAHLLRGDATRALELQRKAMAIHVEMGEKLQEAVSAREIAECHLALGDASRARGLLEAALALARASGGRVDEARTLDALARAERDLGRRPQARAAAAGAIAIVEDIRTRLSTGAQRSAYFAAVRDHYDLYIDLLMTEKRPRVAEAFVASERSRARTLLDTLAAARAEIRTGVDPALLAAAQQRARSARIAEHRHLALVRDGATPARLATSEAAVADAVARYQETVEKIRATSADYAAITQPRALSARDIQRQLPDDVALLEYSLGAERSYLWIVTRRWITGHTLAPRDDIERAARRAYDALTARNRRPPRESAALRERRIARADAELASSTAELAALVLEPAGDALAGRRLLVVGDGALQYVPFGVLPVPGGDGELVVDRYEVAELPAASVLPALARRGDAAPGRSVAILADPVFSPADPRVTRDDRNSAAAPPPAEFARLRFSREEAEAVAALAPDGKPLVALDFSASEGTALSPELGEFGMVHFATHGVLNSRYPELSSLVLSLVGPRGDPVDGHLRLHEIYNMTLRAEVVVLSACETALGKQIRGEGLVGLTRGFLYAGARRVIASLWRVDDRATSELMQRFYTALFRDGLAAPAALRRAQQSMKADPKWSAPYYWAGFVVQGDL